MNGIFKKTLITAMLTASVALFGAGERSVFSRIKVDVKLAKPPVPSVNGSPQSAPRITADPHWLVIRVTFHPQLPRDDGPNYSTYIDGVNMSVQALFPLSRSSSNDYGLFKGGQTLWTVYCDGKTHTAMMFVPPQLLQRYMYMMESNTGSRTVSLSSVRVEVSFTDSTGRVLGRGYYKVSGKGARQEETFSRLVNRVPPQCVIDGAFWEREVTPWRCMAPDQFDLVKPAAVKIPDAPIPPRGGTAVRGPRRVPRSRPANDKTDKK